MNHKISTPLLLVSLMSVLAPAAAYELATHAKMTNFAVSKSRLGAGDGSLLKRIGIDVWTNNPAMAVAPFRAKGQDLYFDLQSGQPFVRTARGYEFAVMRDVGLKDFSTTVRGWLMRGVIREDDGGLVAGTKKGEPLDARDGGQINRFCNHFLDPVRVRPVVGRGFSGYCFNENPVFDAATWSLGTVNTFDPMPYENINRRNHFSVLDAREAMWRALTLRDANGVGLIPATPLTNEDLRKIYWATAFRTVGDVIHTLQDMGNPQHSRNEGHATAGYEEYIDARARQSEKFTIDNRTLLLLKGQLPDLIYEASYPVPRFNRYSDYWSTRVNSANIFGLSDYSNRGFFTLENNFGNTAIYTEPSSVLANYTVVPVFQSSYDDYNVYGARFNHFVGPVEDKLTNSTDTVTMTTQSVFTGLSANGGAVVPPKYSLNAKNYDDRAALLIPRAVAYSAGLIDHFFRGQLEITPPDEGVYSLVDHFAFSGAGQPATAPTTGFKGFKTIKLKLRNATPDIAPSGGGNTAPQIMPGGNLVAVLKFYRNTAYTDNLANEPTNSSTYTTTRSAAEEIVVSTRVKDANGNLLGAVIPVTTTAQTFIFEFDQELPINATDVKLQVVYRGVLGSEADAVVVETVDISEPSYFTYMNASDYIGIGSSVYTRLQINTSPTLLSKVRPTTCVDAMTNQLREGPGDCFAVKPINFSMKFGTNNNANADVGVANTGQYHRLAMLTTAGGTANIGLTGAVCNAGGSFQLPGRTMQTNYFTEANGTAGTEVIVDPMATPPTRGVPFWRGVICLHDGDQTSFANFPVSWWSPMSTNTGADLFPLATQNFRFGTP